MSKQVPLAVAPRAGSGKSEAKSLRREGRVPAIAYGRDLIESVALSVDAHELWRALNTDAGANAILRLQLDGEDQLVITREIQRHPVKRTMQHVDFVTVSRDVAIDVEVPIPLTGEAPGVDEGGLVDQDLYSLPVRVLPLEVPDEVTLDISDLGIGDTKRVEDLELPARVEALEDPETVVVSVYFESIDVPEPGEEGEEPLEEELAEGEEPGEEGEEPAEGEAGAEATEQG